MTTLFQWLASVESDAWERADTERLEIISHYYEAAGLLEDDAQRAKYLLERGIMIAQRVSDPCLELFCEYWRCELFVFYLCDLVQGVDAATRLVVKATKPAYEHCPIIPNAYRILLDAHVRFDPVGFQEKADETIQFMNKNFDLDADNRVLLHFRRAEIAISLEDWDSVTSEAEQVIAELQSPGVADEPGGDVFYRHWHGAYAYSLISLADFRRGRLRESLDATYTVEYSARYSGQRGLQAIALMWQALLLLLLDEPDEAPLRFQRATNIGANLDLPLGELFYEPASRYQAHLGNIDAALRLLEHLIEEMKASGSPAALCDALLLRCKVLCRAGRPATPSFSEARHAAKSLKSPGYFLERLVRVEQGDLEDY